ncbi:TadE family type IV pilus minor pilin [Phytoactinopolyspora halotolerans]|uniref:Pilus assembly protein TadE n=1 Tax=Phytoactinopolyspora halotolerans TaxID=1981512 RepID=A0A6L9S3G9_9ACTN|nr:TadE family type IV pilus minor pilin [Phytoactinopolyspora halotolerans]NED99131.1 hypothetical protein [Phytoactinopolyspora halotolerans]
MVTAELAAALPALALVMMAAIWVIGLTSIQLQCSDAAREAARAAARGESIQTVRDIARTVAPRQAEVEIEWGDNMVKIEIRASLRAPAPLGAALSPTVSGHAIALEERP